MQDKLPGPTYSEQLDLRRQRLIAALSPQNDAERTIIEWLLASLSMNGSLDTLVSMVERVAKHGTASAYDRGYREGQQYPYPSAVAVCQACRDNRCDVCERPRGSRLTAEGEERRTCCCGRRFV